MFKRATKEQSKLRLALIGPSGSGKTYSALAIASHLGDSVAVIDSEHRTASKYADLFVFDTCELQSFHPQVYIDAIHEAERAGYETLIIDSLSHAWMGKDGTLEQVDRIAKRSGGSSFNAWRDVTPLHNQLVEAMLRCSCHLIVTMRSKTEYVMEEYEVNGKKKTKPVKVGLEPIQRAGLEYEFDVCGEMNQENELIVSKSRCPALTGQLISKPGEQIALTLQQWLSSGVPGTPAVDREQLLAISQQELTRLNWTATDGKNFLKANYNKLSRQLLTDEELIAFCNYLQTQESAS